MGIPIVFILLMGQTINLVIVIKTLNGEWHTNIGVVILRCRIAEAQKFKSKV